MHRRDLFSARCSATRDFFRFPDIHDLARRWVRSSFLACFSPGGAHGFIRPCPSQVCSRGWVNLAFLHVRAHVSLLRRASRARLIFVEHDPMGRRDPIDQRDLVVGVAM
jgi:hypothetical protein